MGSCYLKAVPTLEARMKKILMCSMLTLALAGGTFLASATPADAIGINFDGKNKSKSKQAPKKQRR